MEAGYGEVNSQLRRVYEQKGMYEQALAADERLRTFKKRGELYPSAGRDAAAIPGAQAYWRTVLQLTTADLDSLENRKAAEFRMAEIHAQLGEKDQAFQWLEKAYEEHSFWLPFLKVHPHLDSLHGDPRFEALLRKMNLPDT